MMRKLLIRVGCLIKKPLKWLKHFILFLLTHDLSRGLIRQKHIFYNRFNGFSFNKYLRGQLKLIISLFLFTSFFTFSQEKKESANVELPDFVITGKDVISIQKAKKIPPEIISTMSEEFLKPAFSPEELELKDISNPMKNEINLFDTLDFFKGNLNVGIGRNTLPLVDFSYAHPFKYGILEGFIGGKNIRAYVPNSNRSFFNGGLNLKFNVDNESPFIPGTEFSLHGDYGTSGYKFFILPDPGLKRIFNQGRFSLDIKNLLSDRFIAGGSISDNLSSLQNENFTENVFNANGFARVEFSNFNIGLLIDFHRQYITNNTPKDLRFNFFGIRPTVGLEFSKVLKAAFGLNYSESGKSNFLSPYASVGIRFNKNLSLFGEFSPQAEFLTAGYFLNANRYFNQLNFYNIYYKKINQIKGVLKYEFEKYFEIDGGMEYYQASNQPYFWESIPSGNDTVQIGKFDIVETKAWSLSIFSNLLFHLGPYGIFYGTIKLNDVRDPDNFFIPYHPVINASMTYGYDFKFGLNTQAALIFASKSYADIKNTQSISSYVDLSLNFAYKIIPNISLTLSILNLMDKNNYIWKDYLEPPLDIIGGVSLKF